MYQDLIALRTTESALRANANAWVYHSNNSADVIAMQRWENEGDSFVVVANFSNNDYGDYRIGLPREGQWGVVHNTQDIAYDGSGIGTQGMFSSEAIANGPFAQSASLELPAMSVLVLKHEPSTSCFPDYTSDGMLNFLDVSAFLQAFGQMDPSADYNADKSFNFLDVSAFLADFAAGCP
jgi:hypothetical protein